MANRKEERYILTNSILFLIIIFCFLELTSAAPDGCPCSNEDKTSESEFVPDLGKTGQLRRFYCCPSKILGFVDDMATISWKFKGKPLDLIDQRLSLDCRNEVLTINRVEESDSGNYSCEVKSSNGTKKSHTKSLRIYPSRKNNEGPKDIKTTREGCSAPGNTVILTCSALVGKPGSGDPKADMHWFFISPNSKRPRMAKGNIKTSQIDEDGILRSQLEIPSMNNESYGLYICNAKNSINASSLNISLTKEDKEGCTNQVPLIVLNLVVAGIGIVLLTIYCWLRFRWTMKIVYMEKRRKIVSDGSKYDVFVVHGETTKHWVMDVLVGTLENVYGYSCFLPDRDMDIGELIPQGIASEMANCRRVLVVMSPCLLKSKWSEWTVQQGIKKCLTSTTRIVGIELQDFGSNAVSLETAGLMEILKTLKKIKVPDSYRQQDFRESFEDLTIDSYKDCDQDFQGQLKIIIPSLVVTEPVGSSSPKNQRLSNMITGSNHASRENLNERKDIRFKDQEKKEKYLEEVPGSPCSITPFILPSCRVEVESKPWWYIVFSCIRNTFLGDPEILFWHEVRLRLDSPTGRKRNVTAETMA